ncbi:MAG: D-alanine--D-alanine ligase [Peptoniphilaceae bacterium]|uniref:carboxylate--amine ligase n=1 Tax=Parvimonas sp. TaxID=1944660 RepID=UPI0025FB99C2|nr:D-alanine--D-alanine ligase [Parvimonas sp.]MCI5997879.1 D-alanine--D-alanine ligase [Parvimonas sp.]MDD7765127.1 D-alanine--D-alanine ligase [Peptoniphilaceae bacterium]MDY3051497.1 D-alanine--D-alanine ligase [Parvimonas sp.]
MNKAIVLGCNYYIGLSVIRCLGKENVHVVACDYDFDKAYGAKSKYVDEFLKIDTLGDIDDRAVNDLISYAKNQEEKPVLFPTHDKYVEFIDKYYDVLKEYFLISQAKDGLNSILMDKWKLSELAEKNGVKIPATISIVDENLLKKVDKIGYPCILKPVDTVIFTKVFRKKAFICNSADELKKSIEKCEKNNIVAFVQEIVPGFDDHMLTYDFYIDSVGKTTHYATFQKLRQWPINFGASVFTIQKYNNVLIDIGKPFVENIGYRGFGEIEFKKHEKTGEIYLIEINARTTNFNNLIYRLGINMPYIAYLDLTGKLNDKKFVDYDTNYAFIYGFEDFMALRGYAKTKQLSFFKGFFQIFTKKLAPAIWEVGDIRPWLCFNNMLLKKVLRKIFRR